MKTDENKLRPVDVPVIETDISEIITSINWIPKFSLDTTLINKNIALLEKKRQIKLTFFLIVKHIKVSKKHSALQ